MRKRLNFFRRLTSAALALCCLFSMFPTAGAANTSTKEKRSIWLISQPGFGIRIEQPSSGNTGVYFMNMQAPKNADGTGEADGPWLETKLWTDSSTGEQYYVLKPTTKDTGIDNTANQGDNGVLGNYQDDIGFLRIRCDFHNRILPDTSIPNWQGTYFTFKPADTQPFNKGTINSSNQNKAYWAGNRQGGSMFYIGYRANAWEDPSIITNTRRLR